MGKRDLRWLDPGLIIEAPRTRTAVRDPSPEPSLSQSPSPRPSRRSQRRRVSRVVLDSAVPPVPETAWIDSPLASGYSQQRPLPGWLREPPSPLASLEDIFETSPAAIPEQVLQIENPPPAEAGWVGTETEPGPEAETEVARSPSPLLPPTPAPARRNPPRRAVLRARDSPSQRMVTGGSASALAVVPSAPAPAPVPSDWFSTRVSAAQGQGKHQAFAGRGRLLGGGGGVDPGAPPITRALAPHVVRAAPFPLAIDRQAEQRAWVELWNAALCAGKDPERERARVLRCATAARVPFPGESEAAFAERAEFHRCNRERARKLDARLATWGASEYALMLPGQPTPYGPAFVHDARGAICPETVGEFAERVLWESFHPGQAFDVRMRRPSSDAPDIAVLERQMLVAEARKPRRLRWYASG